MGDSFKKIKNKYLLFAILKSLIIGVASGLGGVGVAFLIVTLGKFDFNWVFYIPIACGLFLAVSVPLFIKEYPTDIKVAKRIDKEYDLKERVQTMVEYRDSDSSLAELQRNDAKERLKAFEKKRIPLKRYAVAFVVAVICLSIFASGLAVVFTSKAETDNPNGYVEPFFEYTLPRQNAMKELIENIKVCNLNEETKGRVVARLEELHNYVLEKERKISEVKGAVSIAVAYIDVELEGLTTYREVHSNVDKVSTPFADGIVAALNVYKQYSYQFTNYSTLAKTYNSIVQDEEVLEAVSEYFDKTKNRLLQTNTEEATTEMIKTELTAFLRDADIYLVLDEGEESGNELLKSFVDLKDGFATYKDKINEYIDIVGVRAELTKQLDAFYQKFSKTILDEIYPCMIQSFVRNKMCAIFALEKSDLPKTTPDPLMSNKGEDPDDSQSGNKGEGGGGGTGDTLYGSDDVIYDPDQAKYVQYGKILAEHEAKMHDTLMSSDLPEEMKKAILAYFEYLSIFNEKE